MRRAHPARRMGKNNHSMCHYALAPLSGDIDVRRTDGQSARLDSKRCAEGIRRRAYASRNIYREHRRRRDKAACHALS